MQNLADPQSGLRLGPDDAPATASKDLKSKRSLLAESVTINRPAQQLYDFWRDPTNLVSVMENIERIEVLSTDRSRWTVKAPGGAAATWEAVVTRDIPGKELTWQSTPESEIANSGRIVFEDAGARGTIVRATIAYDPPGGKLATLIAKLFQREPRVQTRRDLHRFKQLMETGEIATGARNRRLLAERNGS